MSPRCVSASRPLPAAGACNYLAKVVLGGNTTLHPGVYCGGLIVSLGANVKMTPGIYVIKDGPFLVNGNAKLSGDNVGIYMKGLNSNLKFDAQTTIDLTAPKSGPMAGLLILDDPTGAPALLNPVISGKYTKLLSSAREHLIRSNNARTLLGTIYMPKGRLIIDANQPVADKSGLHGAGRAAARPLQRAEPHSEFKLRRLGDSGAGRRRHLWSEGRDFAVRRDDRGR